METLAFGTEKGAICAIKSLQEGLFRDENSIVDPLKSGAVFLTPKCMQEATATTKLTTKVKFGRLLGKLSKSMSYRMRSMNPFRRN